jgi:hypothetical protein
LQLLSAHRYPPHLLSLGSPDSQVAHSLTHYSQRLNSLSLLELLRHVLLCNLIDALLRLRLHLLVAFLHLRDLHRQLLECSTNITVTLEPQVLLNSLKQILQNSLLRFHLTLIELFTNLLELIHQHLLHL